MPESVAEEVHREVLALCRRSSSIEHALAKQFVRIHAEKLHQQLGYASFLDYAVEALGLPPSKAEALLRIGRSLDGLPILDAAWAAGEIEWTKAREILKVLTPENEAAWVERAKHASNRELERDLDRTLVGEPPPAPGKVKDPARTRMTFRLDTADAEVVRTVIQWARSQLGEDRDHVGDGEILASLLQRVMHDVPKEEAPPTAERFRIVVQHCPDCGRTEGTDCELTDGMIAQTCCDAEVVDLRPGPDRGRLTHAIPAATRRFVLHRDELRCQVPGCTNRLFLEVHHVHARAVGGGHRRRTSCASARSTTGSCTTGCWRPRRWRTGCGSRSRTGGRC